LSGIISKMLRPSLCLVPPAMGGKPLSLFMAFLSCLTLSLAHYRSEWQTAYDLTS
jgi:hypothetical protein